PPRPLPQRRRRGHALSAGGGRRRSRHRDTGRPRGMSLARCRSLSISYMVGSSEVRALDRVDLDVGEGDSVALLGRSGSGKTTLLHALGGLVEPTEGAAEWKGRPLQGLDQAARGTVRARGIAYVFQGA